MANRPETIAYLLEQLHATGDISARPMFGGHTLYADGKVVALIVEDKLFVRATPGGRAHIGEGIEAPAYKGAKPSFLVSADQWDDAAWLCRLIRVTAAELPAPKPQKAKPRQAKPSKP